MQEIATVVGQGGDPPIICGLARALKKDIDVGAWNGWFQTKRSMHCVGAGVCLPLCSALCRFLRV